MKLIQKWWGKASDQRGAVNPMLIVTILLSALLIVVAGGFVWAYMQMTDYKNNAQQMVDAAVADAKKVQQDADEKHFKEEDKKPNRSYVGPSELGSVRFNYPKTWAGFTQQSDDSRGLVVYFYPYIVPVIKDGVSVYALRVKVVTQSYDDVLKNFESRVKDGKATASTIVVGKTDTFSGYDGVRIDGQVTDTITGAAVIFKVRDKTLELFCDSSDYMNDFNNTILKTLQFQP